MCRHMVFIKRIRYFRVNKLLIVSKYPDWFFLEWKAEIHFSFIDLLMNRTCAFIWAISSVTFFNQDSKLGSAVVSSSTRFNSRLMLVDESMKNSNRVDMVDVWERSCCWLWILLVVSSLTRSPTWFDNSNTVCVDSAIAHSASSLITSSLAFRASKMTADCIVWQLKRKNTVLLEFDFHKQRLRQKIVGLTNACRLRRNRF